MLWEYGIHLQCVPKLNANSKHWSDVFSNWILMWNLHQSNAQKGHFCHLSLKFVLVFLRKTSIYFTVTCFHIQGVSISIIFSDKLHWFQDLRFAVSGDPKGKRKSLSWPWFLWLQISQILTFLGQWFSQKTTFREFK